MNQSKRRFMSNHEEFGRFLKAEIKRLGKDKVLPEDAAKQAEKDIQDQTDKYVAKVDAILAEKEKDIMTV